MRVEEREETERSWQERSCRGKMVCYKRYPGDTTGYPKTRRTGKVGEVTLHQAPATNETRSKILDITHFEVLCDARVSHTWHASDINPGFDGLAGGVLDLKPGRGNFQNRPRVALDCLEVPPQLRRGLFASANLQQLSCSTA